MKENLLLLKDLLEHVFSKNVYIDKFVDVVNE